MLCGKRIETRTVLREAGGVDFMILLHTCVSIVSIGICSNITSANTSTSRTSSNSNSDSDINKNNSASSVARASSIFEVCPIVSIQSSATPGIV